jgi:hypothetical protein
MRKEEEEEEPSRHSIYFCIYRIKNIQFITLYSEVD